MNELYCEQSRLLRNMPFERHKIWQLQLWQMELVPVFCR